MNPRRSHDERIWEGDVQMQSQRQRGKKEVSGKREIHRIPDPVQKLFLTPAACIGKGERREREENSLQPLF